MPRRQMQAAQTRRDILIAARSLFAEHGYAATSMNDIAEEAGVALQTVYASVGPKATIVMALDDIIDEEAGRNDLVPLAMAETDPRLMIAWAVRIPYMYVERSGDYLSALISAAAVEKDAADAIQAGWNRHKAGHLHIALKLMATGAIRRGLTLEDVHATLSLPTWAVPHLQAREALGWDGPTWERWCVTLLTHALLVDAEPAFLPADLGS
jgi:AcrR family transcriptional regulator